MKRSHWLGGTFLGNCFFVTLNLYLRRKLEKPVVCSSSNFPYIHWMGIAKRGNLIRFKSTKRKDCLTQLIFEGKIKIQDKDVLF